MRWRSPPDGSWLATGSDDNTVRIWDPATGSQRHTLTGHTGGVEAVAIAPDGSWLASTGRDGTVRIWDPTSARVVAALRVAGDLRYLALRATTVAMAGLFGPYVFVLT